MDAQLLRLSAQTLSLFYVCTLFGCTHPARVRPRPVTPAPASVESANSAHAAAPPVTLQDLDAAQRAVRADPHSSATYLRLGEVCLALGKIPEGTYALRQSVLLDPHAQPPLIALARLYQNAGYLDREINVLRRLVALHTSDPKIYLRLAQIYLALHWLEPARPLLEQTLKLDPNSATAQIEMASYLFLSGKTAQSISLLQAAHRRFSDDPHVANQLGQYFLATHNYPPAESALRETLRLHPSDVDLQVELAFILMQESRPDLLPEATSLLQSVIQSGQRLPEAYTWLGRIYESQGRLDAAVVSYQNAVRLEPAFENVTLALGRLYLRQGKKQEGEKYIHFYQTISSNSSAYSVAVESLDHHPDDPNAHAKVAGWYMRLKQYQSAIVEWKRVLELRPNDATARKQLSLALLAAGRTTEAKSLHSAPISTVKNT